MLTTIQFRSPYAGADQLAATVILAAGRVAAELRATRPLIDLKMMRTTAVRTNNLVALLTGVGMYATFAFLPEFVQTPRWPDTRTGVAGGWTWRPCSASASSGF